MIVQTPLMALLETLRVKTIRLGFLDMGEPWGGTVPPQDHMSIHLVLEGHAWLSTDSESFALDKGDMVLVGQNLRHRLADSPDGQGPDDSGWGAKDPDKQVVTTRELGGNGDRSRLLCMALTSEGPANAILRHSLRNITALRLGDDGLYRESSQGQPAAGLGEIVKAIEVEATAGASEVVLTRLAEAMLIMLIRAVTHGWQATGSALTDSDSSHGADDVDLDRVLVEMYTKPDVRWSVTSLANVARMSRSKFAALFVDKMGVPPMSYLASWRMEVAHDALHRGARTSIGQVATQVGYTSEGAFSQAFRQHWGTSPSSVIRRDR